MAVGQVKRGGDRNSLIQHGVQVLSTRQESSPEKGDRALPLADIAVSRYPQICYPSLYVIMEETAINPTNEQAQACLRVCQMLSNRFRDIHLFRYNPQKGYVYILAGDNLEVIVMSSGEWRFIYESEI
ncbi:hypothetical protein NG793_00315 [Laspinema sp. C5]|nr:hypothetical protein [Laspinema sp. D3c]